MLIGVVLFSLLVVVAADFCHERLWRRKLLSNRSLLAMEDVVSLFPELGEYDEREIMKAWVELARSLHVKPGLLRADDMLSELKPKRFLLFTDMENVEALLLASRKDLRAIGEAATVRDIVRLLVITGNGKVLG